MSSRPAWGLLVGGSSPVWRTVDLERGRTLLAAACDEAEQPGQAEGMVAVRVRHEDLVHHRRAHHAALQLDLRPLTRVEEPEGVFHLYVGNKPAQASAAGAPKALNGVRACPSLGQTSNSGRAGPPHSSVFYTALSRTRRSETSASNRAFSTQQARGAATNLQPRAA